jgi:predicted nucleotidyltransferase
VDLSRPYRGIAATVDGDVLVALAGTTRPLSGRQVARLVRRGSQPAVNAALDRLVAHGLVVRQSAPPALLHTLNRNHVGWPAVDALAGMRARFLRRAREELSAWSIPAANASLFGSAARADGDVDSDIDLFVVRPRGVDEDDPAWRDQLGRLESAVSSWTGNRASILEFDEAALPRLAKKSPPVLAQLRADGIQLFGTPLDDLMAPRS